MSSIVTKVILLVVPALVVASSPTQLWESRYNGPGNGYDCPAKSTAVDGDGYVYVTGYSLGSGTNFDCATIKYNSNGDTVWVRRYNGTANGDDNGLALAVDGASNVYMAGYSQNSGADMDYLIIKYNSAGVEQWVSSYNGSGNGDDCARSVAIDGEGNVYVTGYSTGVGTGRDYATVKYNSAGAFQWAASYNGSEDWNDYAQKVAVDGSGNVYVAGYATNVTSSRDFVIIKYNPAGEVQWTAVFNCPIYNSDDYLTSMAIDGSGNVYVAGYTYCGGNLSYNYTTVKYNTAGAEQWVATYNGPVNGLDVAQSIAVDGSGNVYVTGYSQGSGTGYDYLTIKYNPAGAQEWLCRYDGPVQGDDFGFGIALDGPGNVYVTGFSAGSGSDNDYATVKYNSAGVEDWVIRYNGPENALDNATAVAVTGSGLVYVTGYSMGSGSNYDYATIAYSPPTDLYLKGEEPLFTVASPAASQVWAGATYTPRVTVGNNGPVKAYGVTAVTRIGSWNTPAPSLTSLASGAQAEVSLGSPWTSSRVPATVYDRVDTVYAIAPADADLSNNRIAITYATVYDGRVVSIDVPAETVWTGYTCNPKATVKNNSPQGAADFTVTCTITPGGYSSTKSVTNLAAGDSTQVSFDPWTTGFTSQTAYTVSVTCQTNGDINSANNTQAPTAVTYDDVGILYPSYPTGSVYAITDITPVVELKHYSPGNSDDFDVIIRVEDEEGKIVYEDVTTAPGLTPNEEREFFVSANWHTPTEVGRHFTIWAFTSLPGDGNPANDLAEWEVVTIPKPDHDVRPKSIDSPRTIKAGDLYTPRATVENPGINPATFWTYCTISTGFAKAPYLDSVRVSNLASDRSQQLTFKDWTAEAGSSVLKVFTALAGDQHPENDTATLELAVTGIAEVKEPLPGTYSLTSGHPNPFSTVSEIHYSLPVTNRITLAVYDLNGNIVRTLVEAKEAPGYKLVSWNGTDNKGKPVANGIYFVRLKAKDYVATRKLVLIR